jgi:hypothetical protein
MNFQFEATSIIFLKICTIDFITGSLSSETIDGSLNIKKVGIIINPVPNAEAIITNRQSMLFNIGTIINGNKNAPKLIDQ